MKMYSLLALVVLMTVPGVAAAQGDTNDYYHAYNEQQNPSIERAGSAIEAGQQGGVKSPGEENRESGKVEGIWSAIKKFIVTVVRPIIEELLDHILDYYCSVNPLACYYWNRY